MLTGWPNLSKGFPIRMSTVQKITLFSLIAIALCIIAWSILRDSYFYATSPRSPDPQNAFIYPVNVHYGTTVYLNSRQYRWYSQIARFIYFTGSLLAVTLAYILQQKWQKNSLGDGDSSLVIWAQGSGNRNKVLTWSAYPRKQWPGGSSWSLGAFLAAQDCWPVTQFS